MNSNPISAMQRWALVAAVFGAVGAWAQTPAPPDAEPAEIKAPDGGAPAPPAPLAQLAWLEGCWQGTVNRREYREHWMPLRGNLLVGVSQTVARGRTQGFEYLRLESRPDGVYYVASPPGKTELALKLSGAAIDVAGDGKDQVFTFVNPALDFPQKITYRRGSDGWLYAGVEGKSAGVDKQVTYPMRRIDCESGELILR